MSQVYLAEIAGIILSLGFSYIPGLKDWYAGLDGTKKRLTMLVCIVIAAAGIFAVGCIKLAPEIVACDQTGAMALVKAAVAAFIANQAAFVMTPKPKTGITWVHNIMSPEADSEQQQQ